MSQNRYQTSPGFGPQGWLLIDYPAKSEFETSM